VVASPLLVGHENDWLEAHPIDDHITLANAYFVIFLSFLTQEIVPGFWIHTAATPLTLLELWGRCGHPKTTIVLLLSSISENIICVGKSTGLWSLWIFFSQKKPGTISMLGLRSKQSDAARLKRCVSRAYWPEGWISCESDTPYVWNRFYFNKSKFSWFCDFYSIIVSIAVGLCYSNTN